MRSTSGISDPYLHPGTNVLKNLRGLIDPEQLSRFEAAELIEKPLPGRFDIEHLKAVHRYIFQDVNEWAGQFRTVNLSKEGHLFGLVPFLEPVLLKSLEKLRLENYLLELDVAAFAGRAAYFLGELNAVHPFREGNGRTQREFLRDLALRAGHYIDWRRTTPEEMLTASRLSHVTGDLSLLTGLLRSALREG
jgi:cell filamentation protein